MSIIINKINDIWNANYGLCQKQPAEYLCPMVKMIKYNPIDYYFVISSLWLRNKWMVG